MDRRILEQIDACRHGPGDRPVGALRAAELSDLSAAVARGDQAALRAWARVAAADAAIEAAIRDVPVPNDLGERLLVALKAAEQGEPADLAALRCHSGAAASSAAQAVAAGHEVASREVTRRAAPTRRAWLGWSLAAVAAVAAACAAFALLYPWSPTWVTQEGVSQQIHDLYDGEIVQIGPAHWIVGAPVIDLPFFASGGFPQPQRWRELRIGGHGATAYDLLGEGFADDPPRRSLKRATLIVIDRRVQGLDFAPPADPPFTQGRRIGVWQTETQVFALVVEGSLEESLRDYQRLIGPQGSFT